MRLKLTKYAVVFLALFFMQTSLARAAPTADFFIEIRSFCGNGIAESDEACDGSDLHGAICVAPSVGTLSCNADCTLNVSECVTPAPSGGGSGGRGPSYTNIPPQPPTPASNLIERILAPLIGTPADKKSVSVVNGAPWERIPDAIFTKTSVTFSVDVLMFVQLFLWLILLIALFRFVKALSDYTRHKHKYKTVKKKMRV